MFKNIPTSSSSKGLFNLTGVSGIMVSTLSFAFQVTDKNSQSLAVLNDEETNEILSTQVKDILWDNNLRFKVMT